MHARSATQFPDRLIAALAEHQHGVVTYGQLLALGLGRGAIAARVRAARLHRIHVGVYAVGHAKLTVAGRRMAAVLACGAGAVLSHHTAADAWGIRSTSSPRIHVTVPTVSGRRRRPGIVVHRTRRLGPSDVAVVDGIPTTSVARTLRDLSAMVDDATMRRTIERTEQLRLFDRRAVLAAFPGRPGRRLQRAVAEADPAPVRSPLESDFLALCRDYGIPRPEVNVRIDEMEVDFLWRSQRVIVETDGWEFHRTRRAFETDHRRTARLQAVGFTVLRFTHEWIAGDPADVAGIVLGHL